MVPRLQRLRAARRLSPARSVGELRKRKPPAPSPAPGLDWEGLRARRTRVRHRSPEAPSPPQPPQSPPTRFPHWKTGAQGARRPVSKSPLGPDRPLTSRRRAALAPGRSSAGDTFPSGVSGHWTAHFQLFRAARTQPPCALEQLNALGVNAAATPPAERRGGLGLLGQGFERLRQGVGRCGQLAVLPLDGRGLRRGPMITWPFITMLGFTIALLGILYDALQPPQGR